MKSTYELIYDDDGEMFHARDAAQQSFKYFWRELTWERRRIVPGLDLAAVKLGFTDGPRTDGKSEYEFMWVAEVDFDGETLSGELRNRPNWLTSVEEGDEVEVPFALMGDWLMGAEGRAYGGFTMQVLRSRMDDDDREQHDAAWGLDFGDYSNVPVEIERSNSPPSAKKADPQEFKDHPMCVNMLRKYETQFKSDPGIARVVDRAGWTQLHTEALAGNLGVIKLLLAYGADITARTRSGRTAADLARGIGWSEIANYLDEQARI